MVVIARLLAVAVVSLALALAGCSHRKPGACSVTCADGVLCPDGTSCASDGFCHAADDVALCPNIIDRPDAGRLADGGGPLDDADPDRPDADPDRPDADPCAGAPNRASASDANLYFIPDGDLSGIDLTLSIDRECVTVETVRVSVEIIHSYRGDVEIYLTSPSGDSRLLLASSDDPREDIFADFTINSFAGEDARGDWVLTVVDVLAEYTGLLQYWSIGINRAAP